MLSEGSLSAAAVSTSGSAGVEPMEGPQALQGTQAEHGAALHSVAPSRSLPSSPLSSPRPAVLPPFSTPSSPLHSLSEPILPPSDHEHGTPDSALPGITSTPKSRCTATAVAFSPIVVARSPTSSQPMPVASSCTDHKLLHTSDNPTDDLVDPLLQSFASLHVEDGVASAKARMPSPPLWYVPASSPVHHPYHC